VDGTIAAAAIAPAISARERERGMTHLDLAAKEEPSPHRVAASMPRGIGRQHPETVTREPRRVRPE